MKYIIEKFKKKFYCLFLVRPVSKNNTVFLDFRSCEIPPYPDTNATWVLSKSLAIKFFIAAEGYLLYLTRKINSEIWTFLAFFSKIRKKIFPIFYHFLLEYLL